MAQKFEVHIQRMKRTTDGKVLPVSDILTPIHPALYPTMTLHADDLWINVTLWDGNKFHMLFTLDLEKDLSS